MDLLSGGPSGYSVLVVSVFSLATSGRTKGGGTCLVGFSKPPADEKYPTIHYASICLRFGVETMVTVYLRYGILYQVMSM